MSKLVEIVARFNAPMWAPVRAQIDTAIRQAYDLGMVEASKSGLPKTKSRDDLTLHMLEEVEEDLKMKDKENAFIESLREQYDERGSLSPKQIEALRKFYDNVT